MPTDTKDPCDDALSEQALPQLSSEAALMPDAVDPLMAMLKVMTTYELYNAYLVEHIKSHAIRHIGEKALLACQFDRLCTMDGLRVLALVWKESEFITEQDLVRAGLHRLRPDKKINRNALGGALKRSAHRPEKCDAPDKYARRAQRIVDAAITFGLIEPQDESTKNLKPLRATDRLHALMMDVGGTASAL
jgi:hypothetical protein